MLLCTAYPLDAATPSEFYASLLRRGVAAFETQRYEDAARSLRLAAFGFVDSVEPYQIAHAYLALTYERMGAEDRARDSARRIVAAQRLERRFMALTLPQNVRNAFDALAARVLTAPEVQLLRTTAPATATTTTQPPATTTTPGTTQPRTATATTPPLTTAPRTTTTTPPATTQPSPTPRGTIATTPPATATTTPTQPRPTQPPATSTTQPESTTTQPQTTTTTTPATTQPRPSNNNPSTQPATPPRTSTTTPQPSAGEIASRLTAADRALTQANLDEARRIYRQLLNASLERPTLIRVAEGLYRARDFSGALLAFQRLGTLQRGEEAYRYYVAVALYETGQYERAKRELAAALPFIEITPDVARYRTRIEGAL